MLNSKHVNYFVIHGPTRSLEPNFVLLFFWHFCVWISDKLLMSAEWENTSALSRISNTVDEIPFIFWIEVLVCDCQYAENLTSLVLSQGLVDLGSMVLRNTIKIVILSCCDFVCPIEVFGCLLNSGFTSTWLRYDILTRMNDLNLACPEKSFTICFKFCTNRLFYCPIYAVK